MLRIDRVEYHQVGLGALAGMDRAASHVLELAQVNVDEPAQQGRLFPKGREPEHGIRLVGMNDLSPGVGMA